MLGCGGLQHEDRVLDGAGKVRCLFLLQYTANIALQAATSQPVM
jgi:hypothetical protein